MTGIREILLPNAPKSLRFAEVPSDGMEPTMRRGDFVLFTPVHAYQGEDTYLVDGDLFRCAHVGGGQIRLCRDNQHYSTQMVPLAWFNENVTARVVAHLKIFDRRVLDIGRMA